MSKADDTRHALPGFVADLSTSLTEAVVSITAQISAGEDQLRTAVTAEQRLVITGWLKGLKDSLRILQFAIESNRKLRDSLRGAGEELGVTKAERDALFP